MSLNMDMYQLHSDDRSPENINSALRDFTVTKSVDLLLIWMFEAPPTIITSHHGIRRSC